MPGPVDYLPSLVMIPSNWILTLDYSNNLIVLWFISNNWGNLDNNWVKVQHIRWSKNFQSLSGSLKVDMVVNFRISGISRGACKLTRIPTLIKKKYSIIKIKKKKKSMMKQNDALSCDLVEEPVWQCGL